MKLKAMKKIESLKELPSWMAKVLEDEPVADIDGEFHTGCVVKPNLNNQAPVLLHLLLGYASGEACLLHLESAGFAHLYSVRYYEKEGAQAKLVHSQYVPQECRSLEQIEGFLADSL